MKALLVATVQSHIGQFHRPLAEVLHEAGYEVHAAARNNLAEKNGLKLDFIDQTYDIPFARSPKSPDNIKAFFKLRKLLKEGKYEIVSCNTPMGGIVTRLAAIGLRKKGTRVLYTAHGFHFYQGSPKKNWLVYYPIERTMAHLCETLITITKEDFRLSGKKFHTQTARIHGVGVYTDRYHPVDTEEQIRMRAAEGLLPENYVILCVGELNENKNQKTLILAAEQLKSKIPGLKILLAGNGPKEEELRQMIHEHNLDEQIIMLGYRTDLEKITPAVDLVVSCSHREGLPLNILEAMLCKKPVIASVNRGHKELVKDSVTGYLVSPDAADEYAAKILSIASDKKLSSMLGNNGYKKAMYYSADSVKKELRNIYLG